VIVPEGIFLSRHGPHIKKGYQYQPWPQLKTEFPSRPVNHDALNAVFSRHGFYCARIALQFAYAGMTSYFNADLVAKWTTSTQNNNAST